MDEGAGEVGEAEREEEKDCMLLEEVVERGGDRMDGLVTSDRKAWKGLVKMRMEKLDKWEKSLGHKWTGEGVERNVVRVV